MGKKPVAIARGASGTGRSSPVAKAKAAGKLPKDWTVETAIDRGDTLIEVLRRHGIDPRQSHHAVRAVADIFDPRRLNAGDRLVLTMERRPSGPWLKALNLRTGAGQELTIQVDKSSSAPARAAAAPTVIRRAEGVVKTTLVEALRTAKVPAPVAREVTRALASDPDLPRKPPRNTKFALVYEAEKSRNGVKDPTLRFVALNVKGKVHPVYRYEVPDGDVVFVDKDGRGVTLVDLATPVEKAKVTSGFGWRTHPVYGDRRFHKGVDYAAPAGTAVHAAEDGLVEEIGWRGNYGRYVRIRHNAQLATHYAHLAEFANGLREGGRVNRGQVIGRVGDTGMATGPHLDYGVILGDEHIDPLQGPATIPVRLAGAQLKQFKSYMRKAGAP